MVPDVAAAGVELFVEADPRTLALAGGSTPRELYRRLAGLDRSWAGVHVFFGDERCVPPDHAASNDRMAREALLGRVAAEVHPMTGCDPDAYERELATVFGEGPPTFDLALLGLGEDGHTASLFPGDPALEVADRWVALVDRPDHRRMTLTVPALSAARLAVFLVVGEAKRGALAAWRAGDDLPAARIDAGRVIVLADPEAAGEAPGPLGAG